MKKKKAPVEEAWTHTSENWVDSSAWDSLMEVLNDGWEKIAEWPPLELPPLEFPPMEDPWTDLSAGCKDDVESAKPRQIREDAIVLSKEEPKIDDSHNPLIDELDKSLSEKGMVLLHDGTVAQRFLEYLDNDPLGIPFFEQYGLAQVFFYDQAEQPEKWRKYDGMIFRHDNEKTGDFVFSIGLAKSAIEKGRDYSILVFLHEAAHLLRKNIRVHDQLFNSLLDKLLNEHNTACGTNIKNDYANIEA